MERIPRFGRETLRFGMVARLGGWSMRRQNLSPCYTTRIEDVLRVRTL